MAFFIYSVLFAGVIYLHYHFAFLTLRRMRGTVSAEIDTGYVKLEDYFGQSFRAKLKKWLEQPSGAQPGGFLRVVNKGNEPIYVAAAGDYPQGHLEKEILVIEGGFQCGPACEFEKELHVRHDCRIGPSTQLQAIAVDGSLSLGDGSRVRRWVDVNGPLELRRVTMVESRAVSRTSIHFQLGSQAMSLFAPEIFTEGREPDRFGDISQVEVLELTSPSGQGLQPVGEFDPRRLFAMSGTTYFHDGDLILASPLNLKCDLVVRGDFACPKESYLAGSVKARGSIVIGEASIVKGNLVADSDLTLGRDSIFQGVLHSRGSLRLRHGVRGLRAGTPVAAYSDGPMFIEDNVVVNGKLSSGDMVKAVSAPPMRHGEVAHG